MSAQELVVAARIILPRPNQPVQSSCRDMNVCDRGVGTDHGKRLCEVVGLNVASNHRPNSQPIVFSGRVAEHAVLVGVHGQHVVVVVLGGVRFALGVNVRRIKVLQKMRARRLRSVQTFARKVHQHVVLLAVDEGAVNTDKGSFMRTVSPAFVHSFEIVV